MKTSANIPRLRAASDLAKERAEKKFVRGLMGRINWDARLIAVIGQRGVGKTTLLLQRMRAFKAAREVLYVRADDLYLQPGSLLGLAEEFNNLGGKCLFIDEIHKYENWSQEVKNIYDSLPDLQVVFTGSSLLDIVKGHGDLSRRALVYELHGLSFREYLAIKHGVELPVTDLDTVLKGDFSFDSELLPIKEFRAYLQEGYYPFFKEGDFLMRLEGVVRAVLEVDIPKFANLRVSTIDKLKRLLFVMSMQVPFKPSYGNLAQEVGVYRQLIPEYIKLLSDAGLLMELRYPGKSLKLVGGLDKIYLQNTALMHFFSEPLPPSVGTMREVFFLNQLRAAHVVRSAGDKGDFIVDGKYTFEVGGKNKGAGQISGVKNSFLALDDILAPAGRVIPLWHFGFLY